MWIQKELLNQGWKGLPFRDLQTFYFTAVSIGTQIPLSICSSGCQDRYEWDQNVCIKPQDGGVNEELGNRV